MLEATLRFGGKLIEELSQKIPSTLFALNELIKNSYDAFSSNVLIKVETSKKVITISDDGNGMDADEIERLFHISSSSKKYGHEIEQAGISRITQGSKGLGFLAAFKFGHEVKWITYKKGIRSEFSIKKTDLVSKKDLTGTKIPVATKPHEGKGTIITIQSTSMEIEALLEDLSSDKISEKLAAAIVDKNFNITIEIENQTATYSTNKLKDFKLESEGNQLFYVTYNSEENHIEFYHMGKLVKSVPGLPEPMRRTDYSVSLELVVFHFGVGKNSKSISPLNRRLHDDALYPLVYFNRNLFNNTTIFDPELLRKTSSGSSLPQIIGRISLTSQSNELEFNSDRTNFVENFLTKNLLKNLKSLNEAIQINGSELKKQLQKNSTSRKVPTGKAIPAPQIEEHKRIAASISINRKMPLETYTPSEQIDIEDYIYQIKDSNGVELEKSRVEIFVNGELSSNRILPSVEEPCEKKLNFRYLDPHTGLVSTELCLRFIKRISNIAGSPQRSIFTMESGSNYRISQGVVSNLIYAIDKAYQSRNKDEYLPLIACSIRCIFDISWLKISKIRKNWFGKINTSNLNPSLKKELNSSLMLGVMHVLILLKKNQSIITEISEASGMTFTTINNLLDLMAFGNAVKLSNVGAHSSTSYLSKPKLEECADKCGLFAVICDTLINLDANKASSMNIIKVTDADFETQMGAR